MSRIFNDTHDEARVSSKTRATQKMRAPKYSPKYPSETKYEKEVRIAEAENWKRRKGVVIRKCRDSKYMDNTEVRGEEAEVDFMEEDFNSKLSGRRAIPFTIKKSVSSSYDIRCEEYGVYTVRYRKDDKVMLRGVIYEDPRREDNDIIVVLERSLNGKLGRYRQEFNMSFYATEPYLYEMIEHGNVDYKTPGYYMTL
jgi:hypothetical protein